MAGSCRNCRRSCHDHGHPGQRQEPGAGRQGGAPSQGPRAQGPAFFTGPRPIAFFTVRDESAAHLREPVDHPDGPARPAPTAAVSPASGDGSNMCSSPPSTSAPISSSGPAVIASPGWDRATASGTRRRVISLGTAGARSSTIGSPGQLWRAPGHGNGHDPWRWCLLLWGQPPAPTAAWRSWESKQSGRGTKARAGKPTKKEIRRALRWHWAVQQRWPEDAPAVAPSRDFSGPAVIDHRGMVCP